MLTTHDSNMSEFLRTIPLFEKLDQAELKEVLRRTDPFYVEAGKTLFEQGDEASGMYVLERGEVEVRVRSDEGHDVVLAHLSNGAVIGEMALLSGGPRSATVVSVSQTQGFFLSRAEFEGLRKRGRSCAYKIVLQLARILDARLRQLEERFQQLKQDPEVARHLEEKSTSELIARARLH